MPTLRLLAVHAESLSVDRGDLAGVIARAEADIVVLHGAPHRLRWRSACAAVARRAGLVVVGGGRSGGGNLIMSTLGVDVHATRDVRFAGFGGVYPGGGTVAAMSYRGVDFTVAAGRLLGNSADRLAQAGVLEQARAELVPGDLPSVISADSADRAGTAVWAALELGRAALGGGLFVDTRIGASDIAAVEGVTGQGPQVSAALALPDPAPSTTG